MNYLQKNKPNPNEDPRETFFSKKDFERFEITNAKRFSEKQPYYKRFLRIYFEAKKEDVGILLNGTPYVLTDDPEIMLSGGMSFSFFGKPILFVAKHNLTKVQLDTIAQHEYDEWLRMRTRISDFGFGAHDEAVNRENKEIRTRIEYLKKSFNKSKARSIFRQQFKHNYDLHKEELLDYLSKNGESLLHRLEKGRAKTIYLGNLPYQLKLDRVIDFENRRVDWFFCIFQYIPYKYIPGVYGDIPYEAVYDSKDGLALIERINVKDIKKPEES
jgi:hypothetical protein